MALRPASLALGRATNARWHALQQLQLSNLSVRRLRVAFEVHVLRAGATTGLDGTAPAEGMLVVTPRSGAAIHVPWTITFGPPLHAALSRVRLSSHAFHPSDVQPALLSFIAGGVPRTNGGQDGRPLSRLDLELSSPTGGRIGTLATMRDVLPGRYSYGVTGRDPTGQVLPAGAYSLRLVAYPTASGPPTVRTISFTIQ